MATDLDLEAIEVRRLRGELDKLRAELRTERGYDVGVFDGFNV